ncbi:FAD-dependent oxidoreductase [Edaphovirga cremea]|uniref:FAD-dependent oxidoreductase n=1 Tax=Edaphovirga cremea TaxID=2267246 RepID=UPI000DEEE180|nr:FAD-dependent oxidoreductase [Edaphovirga cremea]
MKLAIIGAGPAGLIAARNALREGFRVVLFEKLERVGGIWNPDSGGAYRNARMQNSRHTFHYSSFPCDSGDEFLGVNCVGDYLSRMAETEGVMDVTRLSTNITELSRTDSGWTISSEQGTLRRQETFDKVIITIGELWQSRQMRVPGIEQFAGNIISSRDYSSPEVFSGKKVLVVGGGVSGADIASDLVPFAQSVSLSVKKLGLFLPRHFQSGPNDMMHSYLGRYLLNRLPYAEFLEYLDKILPDYMRIYRASGYLPATANNNAVHVNEKIIPNIAEGLINVKPQLERFSKEGRAEFVDSSVADYDVIISCVGYEMPDYSFVQRLDRRRLYEHFFWADDPSLSVINPPVDTAGFGAAFPYFDIISQWVLRVFAGREELPPREEMNKWCQEHMQSLHVKRFYDSWLETIRIGIRSGTLPSPTENFRDYWNLITSVVKPEFLARSPAVPESGIMDGMFNFADIRVKLLAGLPEEARCGLLKKGNITETEYHSANTVLPEDVISAELLYSQVYL